MTSAPEGRAALGLAPSSTDLAKGGPLPAMGDQEKRLFAEASQIVTTRCSMCHAAEPVWPGIGIAPKAVRLDTEFEIARQADAIRMQAVITHAMPPNNVTEMTYEERQKVAAWLAAR
jgi:uncharacterized membrane protein